MSEREALPQHGTSTALLAARARRYPDRPFVASARPGGVIERFTYREGAGRIVGVADRLRELGLGKGDRVVTYLDVGDPGLWFYLGCAAIGVVPVPLGPSFSVDALGALARQCRAKAVFTLAELAGKVAPLGLPTLIFGAPVDDAGTQVTSIDPRPVHDPIDRISAYAKGMEPDDIYMYQPTSGSTGMPKLVMRCNVTFPYAGRAVAAALGPDDPPLQRGLVTQSFTHGGGHYNIHMLMHLGACICIPSGIDVAVSLEEAEALQPTQIYLAPRILRALLEAHAKRYGKDAERTPFCGGGVTWINIGGASSDEALLRALEARRIEVLEGYGATEISVVANTPRGRRRPGWAGRIMPDVEARIAEDGELIVRSPYRMAGYFEDEALTRAAFDEAGYYHTGDLAEIDAEGYLHILGRKRDVFNSSEGSNIYPARIEEMLESTPSIQQIVLVGDARPFIVALVVPTDAPPGDGKHDLLDPKEHAALYAKVAADVRAVNQRLEGFERVRRVALLRAPFPADVYQSVGQGKLRRDRKKTLETYAALLARLYDPERGRDLAVEGATK